MALREQYNKANVVPPTTLEYADTTDENDVTPSNNTSLADLYKGKLEELNALSIFQTGSNVSEQAIIPLTHDKKITGGEAERDEATGKFKSWYFVNDAGQIETSDQPLDTALINSPEFLNNEELNSKVINATFEVEETQPYKVDGKLVEITPRNIKINIYHNDVFIGRLPAFKDGMASHLLALREAVVAQEAVTTIPVSDVVSVYHHTNVKPQDFNFGNFQRGKNQISQFGDGLNASSTTTPFFVKRYGNPIEGEIRDSDFVTIDANVSQQEMFKMLSAKGFKFNSPQWGKATPQGATYVGGSPETEYDDIIPLKDSPGAAMELFNDFQESNPEVKGVKVINHIIGGENVDPFYVIYNAKSFYGPGSLSKAQTSTTSVSDVALLQQEVGRLRVKEQEEIRTKFPDAEYKTDGKIDVSKLSAKDKKVYKDIYKRYDGLITPLLEQSKKDVKEMLDKNFEDIIIQIANSKDAMFFNENNEFKNCK